MFKSGLHKRVFILTLMNEIQKYPWTIPWGATSLNLSFAPQQKKYKPEWQMPERSRVERERSKVERSGATTFCPFFLHMSFRSNMSHILQHQLIDSIFLLQFDFVKYLIVLFDEFLVFERTQLKHFSGLSTAYEEGSIRAFQGGCNVKIPSLYISHALRSHQ